MKKIISLTFAVLFSGSIVSLAQTKESLPEMEFEHTKPSDRATKNAIKISQNPEVKDDTLVISPLNYTILKKQEKPEYKVEKIKPAKIVDEPLKKLYKHYAKVGFGNYTSPLVEFSMSNLRSKDYAGSVYLKHYSMNGKLKEVGPPQFSDNEIVLDGKKFFKEFTLNGNLAYKRNVVHRYGFDVDSFPSDSFPAFSKSATKQRFSFIGTSVDLTSSELRPSKWLQKIGIDYYNYQDKFGTTENKFGLMTNLVKDVSKKSDVLIDVGVDYYNEKMAVHGGNNFIPRLRAAFATSGKGWKLKVGLGTALDVTDSLTKGYIYPHVDFQYSLVENIFYFYAGANGDLQRNSFRNLTTENPFIASDVALKNSNQQAKLFAGLRGAFSSKMTFNAFVSQSFIDNMPYYVNQIDTGSIAGNVFDVVYDKTSLLTVGGDLGFQAGEKLMLNASAFYNFYAMDKQLQPWHRPAITGKFTGKYNLKDKIIISADVYYLGPQFGRTYTQDTLGVIAYDDVKIKHLIDVNLGVEYRYNQRFSTFVNFNNIASYRYYRWSQYPSQRFNFMVGLTANF
ncbi:MAG: hypothetical protein AB7G44_13885 [Bacteroidia bacterium]